MILLADSPQSTVHRAVLVPDDKLERFVLAAVPLGLVSDDGWIKDTRLDAQESHIGRSQTPLSQELDRLFRDKYNINIAVCDRI